MVSHRGVKRIDTWGLTSFFVVLLALAVLTFWNAAEVKAEENPDNESEREETGVEAAEVLEEQNLNELDGELDDDTDEKGSESDESANQEGDEGSTEEQQEETESLGEKTTSENVVKNKDYRVVGYYTQWSTYGRDFQVLDMDAEKLTHIMYAFADFCWEGSGHSGASACEGVPNGTVISADPWADYDNPNVLRLEEGEVWTRDFAGNLGALAKLKDEHPHLRTLLSIGGWTFSKHFSDIAASEETRSQFATSAVEFIRKYEMDGIDIDWEYPVSGGMEGNVHRPEDKQNHTLLLQAIRTELDKAEKEDGKKYELTIASSVNPSYLENNEMEEIAAIVDFIDIMTYDFNGSWQSTSAHNAPLYNDPAAEEAGVPSPGVFNVKTAIEGHLNAGVPNDKLVMGLPFYGRSWMDCDNGSDIQDGGYYQNCEGAGNGTWEAGVYDFDDIMNNLLQSGSYTEYWNEAAKVPYLYNEETGEFITYDNERSIAEKAAFIKEYGLGGAMIWELSADRESRLLSEITNQLTIRKPAETIELQVEDLIKNGTAYIFNNGDGKSKVIIPASVIAQLPERTTVEVSFKGVTVSVPSKLIRNNKDLTLQFEYANRDISQSVLVSEQYNLTIYSGSEILSDLGDSVVMVTFKVDGEKVRDWDRLAVYHIDEDGTYSENLITEADEETNRVTARISQFNVFGVFQLDKLPEDSNEPDNNEEDNQSSETDNDGATQDENNVEGDLDDSEVRDGDNNSLRDRNELAKDSDENGISGGNKTDEDGEDKRLPNTATSMFNLMLAGVLLLMLGCSLVVMRRIYKHRN
ncbi:LPXTG-motif cell wall-anchored protein [Gracilibacillus halotolerans]|uniref:chitinase n=1 Tax=Gracilibacillus halotolerans TaxID=74386 RepID=A0A841RR46_9BACI|nr:glycosyl hydrolase family 18 protein [Gracilibacillus halotolerans]MBB6514297.1 LPXTG-motif cell wall-anchored protein [Gracilibacillus halotolerans]